MILCLLTILCFTSRSEAAPAEPQFTVVFAGKEDNYEVVREPQMLVTKAGTLLALAQGKASSHDRSDSDILLSYDDGKTWPVQKTLRAGRFSYSCLARLPEGQVGCIFDGIAEKGEFENHEGAGVLFARFPLGWLTDGKDEQP